MQFPVLKCIMSFYLGLKYMHVCFNECMNVSLSMGVYAFMSVCMHVREFVCMCIR